MNVLTVRERNHSLPGETLRPCRGVDDRREILLTPEEAKAIRQMLDLRQYLKEMYEDWGLTFPYLK